ncbi:MAG: hypothetical protein ACSLFN_02120 [Candidatus Limnocylindrales bacterium]
MAGSFVHRPHPRIAARRVEGPPTAAAEHIGVNGRIALMLTTVVGTMWCAYAFGLLALLVLPEAVGGGLLPLVQWISQTFIQLVMLSVIMVGQNIIGRAADKRAAMTFADTEAIFHEVGQIQAHLQLQDEALHALIRRLGAPDHVGGQ